MQAVLHMYHYVYIVQPFFHFRHQHSYRHFGCSKIHSTAESKREREKKRKHQVHSKSYSSAICFCLRYLLFKFRWFVFPVIFEAETRMEIRIFFLSKNNKRKIEIVLFLMPALELKIFSGNNPFGLFSSIFTSLQQTHQLEFEFRSVSIFSCVYFRPFVSCYTLFPSVMVVVRCSIYQDKSMPVLFSKDGHFHKNTIR